MVATERQKGEGGRSPPEGATRGKFVQSTISKSGQVASIVSCTGIQMGNLARSNVTGTRGNIVHTNYT